MVVLCRVCICVRIFLFSFYCCKPSLDMRLARPGSSLNNLLPDEKKERERNGTNVIDLDI